MGRLVKTFAVAESATKTNLIARITKKERPTMALIERETAKAKKAYCEERREYVVPVAELDWLPAIDAAPVVHGQWMFNADMWTWDCTNCKGWVGSGIMISRYKHCPNCGARMDGGEVHEDN